jgi:hypothetical protein
MRRFLVTAVCGLSLLFSSASYAEGPKSLVKVKKLSHAQIARLASEGFDIAKKGTDFAEIVLDSSEIQAFVKKGHPVKVIIQDLDAYVEKSSDYPDKEYCIFYFRFMQTD